MKVAKYNKDTDTLTAPNGQAVSWHRNMTMEQFQALQVVIHVMVGGGLIGRLFAEQPADAYIDGRVSKRPYSMTAIENVRQSLIAGCYALGLNPHNAPKMPDFPGCWVF